MTPEAKKYYESLSPVDKLVYDAIRRQMRDNLPWSVVIREAINAALEQDRKERKNAL